MSIGAGQVTRFGLGGQIWRPAGDFSGKVEAVVIEEDESPSGGYWFAFDAEYRQRNRNQDKRRKKKEKTKRIESDLDRALALAEREIEEKEERRAELLRLTEIVERETIKGIESERLQKIAQDAIERRTFSAMERMERELSRAREEEQFLIDVIEIVINA